MTKPYERFPFDKHIYLPNEYRKVQQILEKYKGLSCKLFEGQPGNKRLSSHFIEIYAKKRSLFFPYEETIATIFFDNITITGRHRLVERLLEDLGKELFGVTE